MSLAQADQTGWLWRTPQDGKIFGKARTEWQILGVAAWARIVRGMACPVLPSLYSATECNPTFSDLYAYAPATLDGLPAAWPTVDPQPVIVIPAAEVTPQVLYGHQAMGGTWRCSGEQWTPCDERGDFCELRRVVDARVVDALSAERYQGVVAEAGEQSLDGQWFWRQKALAASAERTRWRQQARTLLDNVRAMCDGAEKTWNEGEK